MTDYYQENYLKYHDQTFSIDPASFLSPLIRCLSPSSVILDVGCGSGRDMRWLKERGFQPMGFELSKGLATLARRHSGCRVMEGDFQVHDFSSMDMDALLLVGALVHVPHNQFSGTLSNIVDWGSSLRLTLVENCQRSNVDLISNSCIEVVWPKRG